MATIKSYTSVEQSRKLAKILPLESADMCYIQDLLAGCKYGDYKPCIGNLIPAYGQDKIKCWSLAALLSVLPEINSIPLTLEKVKAEDGYEGYYYHIEYKDKILIPYSKNPIDACVDMILKLNELKIL